MKNGKLLLCDTMKSIRRSLGNREYEIVFKASAELDYVRDGDNYIFRTADVGQIAPVLKSISENNWALVDLSVQQSTLEDMYVELMSNSTAH